MPGPGGTRHAESRPGLEASLSGYWKAVYLETCTHGLEGGGGDGAARQPRRPPTLPAASAGLWLPSDEGFRRDDLVVLPDSGKLLAACGS